MTREENARAALVAISAHLAASPVWRASEAMWQRDLAEVLDAVGRVPAEMRALVGAAENLAYAEGARAVGNAAARLRIEAAAYFERRAVGRVAALRGGTEAA